MNRAPTLLIVDDEADTCRNLADIFSDLGYTVDTAYDGATALAKLEHARFDVALLDLMMPDMDGVSLYQEIKRRHPETVAVLATAFPNHPRAEESRKSGMWQIVPKPLDLKHLLSLFDQALRLPVVLLVDDDVDLCANLWDLLWERGFRVSIAHDIHSATERLQDGGFQIVLIDMRLPDGDGTEVFRAVKQVESQARTILMTGFQAEISRERLQSAEADAICYKPFNVPQFLTLVERLSRV
jgi:DNA-binding NtrC family response regulator